MWTIDQLIGPAADKTITVCRVANGWKVSTERGAASKLSIVNDELEASFSDGRRYVGPASADAGPLHAYWVQPSNPILVSYATPILLLRTTNSCWGGRLSPLETRVRFSLVIRRQDDGSLVADLVDPRWGARKAMKVIAIWRDRSLSDVQIRMPAVWDVHPVELVAQWDPVQEALVVSSDALPQPVTLHKSSGIGPGLSPRVGPPADFDHPPEHRDDGWETATLRSEGFAIESIRSFVESIESGGDLASAPRKIQSLLIARHGKLVFERYFYDFGPAQLHDMRSAGKTIASVLVGTAVARGASPPLDARVTQVFSAYPPFRNDDVRKERMTVRDLMSMRSGFDCDDNNPRAPGNEDNVQQQTETPDWYRYTLNLPMASDPGGEHALYCSVDLNLAGGVARTISGEWLPKLFDETVAAPLGISNWAMNLMPTGEGYMGGGLYLSPRDQLKLGQLYLQKGVWNERRIVSQDWVAHSVTPYGVFRPVTPRDVNHRYGLGWHVHDLTSEGVSYRVFSAEGAGGQFVIVVPDLDLVVQLSGADYTTIQWYNWLFDLMQDYVIPSLTEYQAHRAE